ncbi:chromate efflux transporter [Acetobacteraceae bacterium KSS8]|uniref:Chromate efflux transporter n=1 Tax=Endosaccharibacter trunci TaxID=2812733 RepID=A0ABT1W844_9PROT|nr:chromate efflux transporter [Acetobacteraceae bacterium KSS8]
MTESVPPAGTGGTPGEVLAAFLRLGLSAFGGPAAHIGYFRDAFVHRRRWLDEASYADLVALCQFLPGPASSQVGMALGLMRAGPLGALAAWTGFTLPSALLMALAARGASALSGRLGQGIVHGLKLVAVAVVAQAVLGMARTLTPDARRAAIALLALAIVTFAHATIGQVAAIAAGGCCGLLFCRETASPAAPSSLRVSRGFGVASLCAYAILLLLGPVAAALTGSRRLAEFDAFYRSGALTFGGGHVVLPLLRQAVVDPGWVRPDVFLAGYGAAQAMPGPLFTFGAYLGEAMNGPGGALLALFAVFLPGMLVLLGVLPFWAEIRGRPSVRAALTGANAAVVGVLAAALYGSIWTGSVLGAADFAIASAGFVALAAFGWPPIVVVVLGIALGCIRTFA